MYLNENKVLVNERFRTVKGGSNIKVNVWNKCNEDITKNDKVPKSLDMGLP